MKALISFIILLFISLNIEDCPLWNCNDLYQEPCGQTSANSGVNPIANLSLSCNRKKNTVCNKNRS